MGLFDAFTRTVNNAAGGLQNQITSLSSQNSRLKQEKSRIQSNYNRLNTQHTTLQANLNKANQQKRELRNTLSQNNTKSKINASERFNELKNQYLKKIELIDTQEELLATQNKNIQKYNELIDLNSKNALKGTDKTDTFGRQLLYDRKDMRFYNISLNVLKLILLIISAAIIYLLFKKMR